MLDLLIYGHAGVEILAHNLCVKHGKLKEVNWDFYWDFMEKEELGFDRTS